MYSKSWQATNHAGSKITKWLAAKSLAASPPAASDLRAYENIALR